MGERKVLNKYYPPEFDPSLLTRAKMPRQKQITVRMMLPMTVQCTTCGEFMYRGKKFNAKKEDAEGETYKGIQIFRFYMKCTNCSSVYTIKTDPEHTDYTAEMGVTRNFEHWKETEELVEGARKQREEEEKVDQMKALENRTLDSKREMDILDALDEIQSVNKRHERVDTDKLLERLQQEQQLQQDSPTRDDEAARAAFQQRRQAVRRLDDAGTADVAKGADDDNGVGGAAAPLAGAAAPLAGAAAPLAGAALWQDTEGLGARSEVGLPGVRIVARPKVMKKRPADGPDGTAKRKAEDVGSTGAGAKRARTAVEKPVGDGARGGKDDDDDDDDAPAGGLVSYSDSD